MVCRPHSVQPSSFTYFLMKNCICILFIVFYTTLRGQIPVEFFAGQDRATVDIMFFKWFKNKSDENSRWLFFNRNRAAIDYRQTSSAYLPQFGFTEAISYNHPALKGLAPVWVGQILSSSVISKTGIQYAHIRKDLTLFTWFVCQTSNQPILDYFLLLRYTPSITEKIKLFTQMESINAFPTNRNLYNNFTQRFRLGISYRHFQIGAGADFNQSGRGTLMKTINAGVFIRHEF